MIPDVESDMVRIVLWHHRETPRPQDHVLQFVSGSRQFATRKFSLSSGHVGGLYGGLIAMWKSKI
jgi:hypothetical protein